MEGRFISSCVGGLELTGEHSEHKLWEKKILILFFIIFQLGLIITLRAKACINAGGVGYSDSCDHSKLLEHGSRVFGLFQCDYGYCYTELSLSTLLFSSDHTPHFTLWTANSDALVKDISQEGECMI